MSSDQPLLLAKALQNFRAAQLLLKQELYDAAVSRAYYAAYLAARAALLGIGRGEDKHDRVQAAFAEELVNRRKVYPGKQGALLDLMTLRHKADYRAESVTAKQAARGVRKAEAFVTAIHEELRNDR
ncbi:MAG: HEPN domain-containing protein [Rhodothermales bacterium]